MSINDDDFERQLKRQFLAADDAIAAAPRDPGFSVGVSGRIRRIQRWRLAAKALAAVVLLPVAWFLAPSLQAVAGVAADFSVQLHAEIGNLATTPAAFAVGVLIALAAVVFATIGGD